MKKISKSLVCLFGLLFFLYAVTFMFDWNARMYSDGKSSTIWTSRIGLLLDFLCLLVISTHFKGKIRGIHLICVLWVLIMPFVMFISHSSFGVSVFTILWPLLFEMTYLCSYCSRSYVSTIRIVFIAVCLAGLAFYLPTRINIFKQTNTIYFCFLTLPWLLLYRNKRTTLLLLILFSFLALISLKRSVILCTVLIWMFYYLEYVKKKNILILVISFIVIVFTTSFLYNVVDDRLHGKLTERVTREETDEGHDRLAIWELTISMIQSSSNEKLILGHGYAGVRNDSFLDISAHNDFLEIIYDYGLIIFVLYFGLWIYIIRRCIYLFKQKSPLYLPYSVSLSIMVIMSMVSQLLPYATYFSYLVMFWGMTEAIIESENKKNSLKKRLAR